MRDRRLRSVLTGVAAVYLPLILITLPSLWESRRPRHMGLMNLDFAWVASLSLVGSALGAVVAARRRPLRIPALQGAAFALLHLIVLTSLAVNSGSGAVLQPLLFWPAALFLWTLAYLIPARR